MKACPRFCLLVALMATLMLLVQCKARHGAEPREAPAFHPAISAYSGGVLASDGSIRVVLSEEIQSPLALMEPLADSPFRFRPSLSGKAYWIDARTLEFRPGAPMARGQHYQVDFHVGNLPGLPEGDAVFRFGFQVMQQGVRLEEALPERLDAGQALWYRYRGQVYTADRASGQEMQGLLDVMQDGKRLPLRWESSADGRQHEYIIDSVSRKTEAGQLVLNWKSDWPGLPEKGRSHLQIPALDSFSVVDMQLRYDPEPYIRLWFSDPLADLPQIRDYVSLSRLSGQSGESLPVGSLRMLVNEHELRLYPQTERGEEIRLSLMPALSSAGGRQLGQWEHFDLMPESLKPAVRLMASGVIIPRSEGLIFPFEAVGLRAVEVRVIRIFENNVGSFLQLNRLDGESQLKRAGRLVLQREIPLQAPRPLDYRRWNSFSLDLAELVDSDPGAIYRVEIGFSQSHSIWDCGQEALPQSALSLQGMIVQEAFRVGDLNAESWDEPDGYWDSYLYDNYYGADFDWEQRDNPCHASYYGRRRSVSRNVLASDLGLIARTGADGQMLVAVSDLRTALPLQGVELELFDYQNQSLAKGNSDREGMARLQSSRKPFYLVARQGAQRGYLRLDEASSLSLSTFDVGGAEVQQGLKGFLYTERGVWRPGDSLFVMLMLEDRHDFLPLGHPLVYELINPRGQVIQRLQQRKNDTGLYRFAGATPADAPTGNYTARVSVGGRQFQRQLKIETVRPNRLRIALDFGADQLKSQGSWPGELRAHWLHGSAASLLRARVELALEPVTTRFEGFQGFVFDDALKQFEASPALIFDGRLNEQGIAPVQLQLRDPGQAPGKLMAHFESRVFEAGGDYSSDRFSLPLSPYRAYVGLRLPGNQKSEMSFLNTGEPQLIELVRLDQQGRPEGSHPIRAEVYRLDWQWWWEGGGENLAAYISRQQISPVFAHDIALNRGRAELKLRFEDQDWGRYLIRLFDPMGGHSSSVVVYVDQPGYYYRGGEAADQPAVISLEADRERYYPGDEAVIRFQAPESGRVLVSLEGSQGIRQARWIEAQGAETAFRFQITEDMAPNIYVHMSLIQPHGARSNDLPIRMYGVLPVFVEDPQSRLDLVLESVQTLRPGERMQISLRERQGKPMAYTLAVVDEGLLDLTRFATPDPWSVFYAREALGVRGWDMYDMVLGAYGGRIEQVFSIGGDQEGVRRPMARAHRFPPLVRFFGPFFLENNQTARHHFDMPEYTGSVRIMAVAGYKGAYGNAQKQVSVKSPLMILPSLPRMLGPGDQLSLPVTVFAMEPHVQQVRLQMQGDALLKVEAPGRHDVHFTQTGEKVVYGRLEVGDSSGVGRLSFSAESGRERATASAELQVRNPYPRIQRVEALVIPPGESRSLDFALSGMPGSQEAEWEVSVMPPLNLSGRMRFLENYPFGCLEQITSAVFPWLYLSDLVETTARQQQNASQRISEAIRRIQALQLPSGGFAYWPGASQADEWGSSYAGHFLHEASSRGYLVPASLTQGWLRYQQQLARNWDSRQSRPDAQWQDQQDLQQAYRLYTLALAGHPEMGAMNRLRERPGLSQGSRYRLAAAYVLAGQRHAAESLIAPGPSAADKAADRSRSTHWSSTYGSTERDMAMMLETFLLLDRTEEAFLLARRLSEALSSNRWMSTQTTSYALMSMARMAGKGHFARSMAYSWQIGSQAPGDVQTDMPVSSHIIDNELLHAGQAGSARSLRVTNHGEAPLHLRLLLSEIPEMGQLLTESSGIRMSVRYLNREGEVIDATSLHQGMDFMAEVVLSHPGGAVPAYTNLALTQWFPSGWEIRTSRLSDEAFEPGGDSPDYLDIRDDRVHQFFDLQSGQQRRFRIGLHAAYQGRFFMPGVNLEAMYDAGVYARQAGWWVDVIAAEGE